MKLIHLTYSAAQLEAMTDAELTKSLEHLFPLTRPEQVIKHEKKLSPGKILTATDAATRAKKAQGLAMLKALGINLKL